jgi:hypothetical protein
MWSGPAATGKMEPSAVAEKRTVPANADVRWRYMVYIGHIEAESESIEIDRDRWMNLIDSHRSLGHVPPITGINPFTRQPCEYWAPSSSAEIMIDGTSVGCIAWAQDASSCLLVESEEGSVEEVAVIAEEIADSLGARFVRSPEER